MAQVRLWTVLGEGGVGKSTTVGHLIGHFGKGTNGLRPGRGDGMREILLRGGGYINVVGRRQSLQEAGISPQVAARTIRAQAAREERIRPGIRSAYFNVLLALRTDRTKRLPPAEDYLSYFLHLGSQLESIAVLSPARRDEFLYRRFGVSICYVYDSSELDISQMVGQVRNHFGWA